MIMKARWSPCRGVSVESVDQGVGGWVLSCSLQPKGRCPDCGSQSRRRHGWRRRHLKDLAAHGDLVTLNLRLCRWRCEKVSCGRRTFSDHEVLLARPYSHQTARAAQIIGLLGHAAGGRPAEKILCRLGLQVSDDTILRQLLRATGDHPHPARVIGIDDWSWRKSQTYGAIIVDLERRAVIDVLEDRDVATCGEWLRRHPEVEVISRDRCGLYAQAAREGAPQAVQVADRFHIVQNLRMAIEEQMNLHGRATGRALLSDADYITAPSSLLKSRLAHRKSREVSR